VKHCPTSIVSSPIIASGEGFARCRRKIPGHKDRERRFPSIFEAVAALGSELLSLQSGDNLQLPGELASRLALSGQSQQPTQVLQRPRRWGRILLLSGLAVAVVALLSFLGGRHLGPGRGEPAQTVSGEVVNDLRRRSMAILGEQSSTASPGWRKRAKPTTVSSSCSSCSASALRVRRPTSCPLPSVWPSLARRAA
jgi:hypothetical protein